MGKVVTSAGIKEFVASGKVENVPPSTPDPAPSPQAPVESKPATVTDAAQAVSDQQEAKADAGKKQSIEETIAELGLEKEFSAEELKTIGERVTRSMAQRHRRMKEAQESAAEAERFAETRFNELRQVERERDELQKQLEEAKKAPKAAEPAKSTKPDVNDPKYKKGDAIDWPTYVEDVAAWRAEEAVAADRSKREQEAAEQAAKAREEAAKERFEKARTKYPDFEAKFTEAKDYLLPNAVIDYLTESEHGPDLTYYFLTHPEEGKRISKLSPVAALAETGRLELQFLGESSGKPTKAEPSTSAPPKRGEGETTGGAPAPITPLGGGSGTIPKDPSKMNFRELRQYEREKAART